MALSSYVLPSSIDDMPGWVNAGVRVAQCALYRGLMPRCRGCTFPRCPPDHVTRHAAVPEWGWYLVMIEDAFAERLPVPHLLRDLGIDFDHAWRGLARDGDLAAAWLVTVATAHPLGWARRTDGLVLTVGVINEYAPAKFLRAHFPWPHRWPA